MAKGDQRSNKMAKKPKPSASKPKRTQRDSRVAGLSWYLARARAGAR